MTLITGNQAGDMDWGGTFLYEVAMSVEGWELLEIIKKGSTPYRLIPRETMKYVFLRLGFRQLDTLQ